MSTTTIRLPDDLKERVAIAAERAGMTSHALILDAIAERVEAQERSGAFHETGTTVWRCRLIGRDDSLV